MKNDPIEKKKNNFTLALILIIAINALINYIWLKVDTFPLWFDYGQYFTRSVDIYHLTLGVPLSFERAVLGAGMTYWPLLHRVLLPLVSVPFYYIFGVSTDTAVISCVVFLAAALSATYAIASRLFDRRTALLATFILSVSPGFFTLSRRFSPEFAVIGLVALTIYFLLRSDNFQNRIYSILFGLGFSICMITKESAFAFIPGALIYVLYKIILLCRHDPGVRRGIFLNLFLSSAASAITLIPIYWFYREAAFSRILGVAYSEEIKQVYNMTEPYALAGLTYYLKYLFTYSFGPIFTLCFISGSVLCLRKKFGSKGFIFWWLIGSYILLCTTVTRFSEYSLPLLVPLAIIAAYGISQSFKTKTIRVILAIFIICWGSAKFLVISFPFPIDLSTYRNLIPEEFELHHPRVGDWKSEEIIGYIGSNNQNRSASASVHVGANLLAFSPIVLEYASALKGKDFVFYGYDSPIELILDCDFVVVKGGQNQGVFYRQPQAEWLIRQLEESGDFAILPRKFLLPDGSEAVVYKRIE